MSNKKTQRKKIEFKKFGRLPGRPSELIRIALKDLALVRRSKRYVVDMDMYHFPYRSAGKCHVCFAGAVIAKTMRQDWERELVPAYFREECEALRALDFFRSGNVEEGLSNLRLDDSIGSLPTVLSRQFPVAGFAADPDKFVHDMAALAAALEWEGL
jgi:hypothetical protein